MPPNRLTVRQYTEGILEGNRLVLSRAITLVESRLATDQVLAQQVLDHLLPFTGNAFRLGITGVPGVGKSTFIETFGSYVTKQNKKIAVLTIDPSSQRSGGSIMGDKTRMEELAHNPLAYIRPSPSGDSLGGVAHKTREAMLLCEAAGFEVIVVETVGVGQSETVVKSMVDFFLLLMLAGAGDELQGIKRGIMEMADAVAINKADGDNLLKAKAAQNEYSNALHLFSENKNGWLPPVILCSALQNIGIDHIVEMLYAFQEKMQKNGFWQKNRAAQQLQWMNDFVRETLLNEFYANKNVQEQHAFLTQKVANNSVTPFVAAQELLAVFRKQ
jgi:LAO/AO transport system kinase